MAGMLLSDHGSAVLIKGLPVGAGYEGFVDRDAATPETHPATSRG